jgi:hypothetical protein
MTRLSETASAVAEGLAALSRMTLGPDDQLDGPADVRDVIGGLSLAVSRIPQLLGQLAVFLEIEQVKGAVADNQGADARDYVREVSDALHRAGADAEAMTAALDAAREACEHVQVSGPGMQKEGWRGRKIVRGEDR